MDDLEILLEFLRSETGKRSSNHVLHARLKWTKKRYHSTRDRAADRRYDVVIFHCVENWVGAKNAT